MFGGAPPKGIAAEPLGHQVDFAPHETGGPKAIDIEGATEHLDSAMLGRAPQVDEDTAGMRRQIEAPLRRDRAPLGRGFDPTRRPVPHRGHIARGARAEAGQTLVFKAGPDFGLPAKIGRAHV